MINSAMGAERAYVLHMDETVSYDTTYEEYPLWVSALDLSPDESVLVVGTLTAGWGGHLVEQIGCLTWKIYLVLVV